MRVVNLQCHRTIPLSREDIFCLAVFATASKLLTRLHGKWKTGEVPDWLYQRQPLVQKHLGLHERMSLQRTAFVASGPDLVFCY